MQTSGFAISWSHFEPPCVFQCLFLGPCPFNPVTLYVGPSIICPVSWTSMYCAPGVQVPRPHSFIPCTSECIHWPPSLGTLIFTSFVPMLFRFVISPSRSVFTLLDHVILHPLSLGPCSYISYNIVRWRLWIFSPRTAGVKPNFLKKKASFCHIRFLTLGAADTVEYNVYHMHKLLNELDEAQDK